MREDSDATELDAFFSALEAVNPMSSSEVPALADETAVQQVEEIVMSTQNSTSEGAPSIGSDPEFQRKFSSSEERYKRYAGRSRVLMASAAASVFLLVSVLVVLKPWNPSAASAVQDAAAKSRQAQTGKAVVSGSIVTGSEKEDLPEVVVLFDGQNFEVNLDAASVFGGEDEEIVQAKFVDGVGYFSEDDEWFGIEAPDEVSGLISNYAKPSKVFETIEDLSEVEEIGSETVNGVSITQYRSVIEAKDLLNLPLQSFGLSETENFDDVAVTATVDIYIDDNGFLYKVDSVVEHPEFPEKVFGSVVFSEMGQDIDIEAPADYEELSLDDGELLSLL